MKKMEELLKLINKLKSQKGIAITEILLLLVAVVAIAWIIGSDVGIVRASDGDTTTNTGDSGNTCNAPSFCTTLMNCKTIGLGSCSDGQICCKEKTSFFTLDNILKIGAGAKGTYDISERVVKIVKEGFGTQAGTSASTSAMDALGKSVEKDIAEMVAKEKGIHLAKVATPVQQIIYSAAGAVITATVITLLANKYASQRNAGDLTTVAWIGAGAAPLVGLIVGAGTIASAGIGAAVVAVFAGVYMLTGYQLYSQQVFTFKPTLWQPPVGGSDCERCNNLELAGEGVCSEYICHTYGTACEWINEGSDYELCTEVNPNDKTPPVLTPLKEAYGEPVFKVNEDKYSYVSSSAGTKISYQSQETKGCVPAFTPITLALGTDEKAHCKISIEKHTSGNAQEIFDNMLELNEGNTYTDTHTINLPSTVTASESAMNAAGYELSNGGVYEFYIRCQDAKGNLNTMDYSIGFCVNQGPDLYPPEITGTSPPDGSFIPHNAESIENFQVYTNEPADCRWDYQPKQYDFMLNEFDKCSENMNDPLRGYDFGCEGTLTGLKGDEENNYYIACIDQPELKGTAKENMRNKADPEKITFEGTSELVIDAVAINGEENNSILKGSNENSKVLLEVKTFGGAENGLSRCKYSSTGTSDSSYTYFFNDNERGNVEVNSQELYLTEGEYKYFIRCEDIAGNIATTMVDFSLEVDKSAPQVVRVYKEGSELKILTNEEAECYYSSFGCIYNMEEDGILMMSTDGITHTTDWDTENDFYIKCKDNYGNRPDLDKCSITVRPFEVLEVIDVSQ